MLILKDIVKVYDEKNDGGVNALCGITLSLRKCEFVSVLGPSGCGKTTLLNIVGGLARYTTGDLIVDGKSTKDYNDREWDTYRNHSVGFVFQSYNLIPHQTVLENVELSMTIGGVSKAECRRRAREALVAVGLKDKINKKPNELSGGQMQRVSIARAIVNEPEIILADEPTGALDSETSKTVMELLKEIAKTRLVIMVTHNPELAYEYSDRIIKMLDGKITFDSKPYDEKDAETAVVNTAEKTDNAEKSVKFKKKHSSMSFGTALRLSGKNLLSKKKRTVITSLAASIGIIGIAVILSVSSGMQSYIDKTMLDSASFNYVSVSSTTMDMNSLGSMGFNNGEKTDMKEFPDGTTGIYPYNKEQTAIKTQKLTEEYIEYIDEKCAGLVVDVAYTYAVELNILTQKDGEYAVVNTTNWSESLDNEQYIADRYDVLAKEGDGSGIPTTAEGVALVVDKYNRIPTNILDSLGITYGENLEEIKYGDLLGKEFRVVFNDGWYALNGTTGFFSGANTSNYDDSYADENGITVKITSVLRQKADAAAGWYEEGITYSPKLTSLVLEKNKNSEVATAQVANETTDIVSGRAFSTGSGSTMGGMFGGNTYESALRKLGYSATPTSILIYPVDVASRKIIIGYLDEWNEAQEGEENDVEYMDMSNVVTSMLGTVVDIITYVLIAFSAVSLVISSIMIAIIIYASVIERTKEIGVLRSVGARKKDVSRVFEAEAIILGLTSGCAAILITLLINVVINSILGKLVGVYTIANLPFGTAVFLILLSAFLLLIASLVPAKLAAKKEPSVALRTE